MLLHRRANSLPIFMELKQSFWQLSIIKALLFQKIRDDNFVFTLSYQPVDAFLLILHTLCVKRFKKSKLVNIVEEFFLKICSWHIILCRKKCKHIFEHSACGT